jgi:hypothetical protein
MCCREVAATGDHRLTGGESAVLVDPSPTFVQDRRAARCVDRTVHTAAPLQAVVGGVDDRVDGLRCDVANDD